MDTHFRQMSFKNGKKDVPPPCVFVRWHPKAYPPRFVSKFSFGPNLNPLQSAALNYPFRNVVNFSRRVNWAQIEKTLQVICVRKRIYWLAPTQ